MARPVKWSRDLHPIRERASKARTETWSRPEIEHLFGIGRATAQTLMKAIGEVQSVGGAHFVERQALVRFLDQMIAAPSVEQSLRDRLLEAEPVPKPKTIKTTLPADLRHAMLPDLPSNITLEPGRLEVRAETAIAMLESLFTLAMIMQNDMDRFQNRIEQPAAPPPVDDDDLKKFLSDLRTSHL